MLQRIINSKSKTFLAFCGSFLLGIVGMTLVQAIFFDGFKQIRSLVVYGAVSLLAAVVMIALFWKDKGARFWAVLWFCFLFGIVRYISVFPAQNNISTQNEKSMTLTGYVAVDPDVRIDGVRYIVQIINQPLTGRTYVKSNLYPRYKYGDVLKLGCDLTSPEPIEDFRYDMYLAKLGVFSLCQNPKIQKVDEGGGNFFMRKILGVKDGLAEQINRLWPEPHASFMAGLLYGYRGGLGDLQEAFNKTGVSHIVAISGYNITIIAELLMAMFFFFHIRRQIAFWFVSAGIISFVIMVGASPSVVRAGIMGILVLVARHIGRVSRPTNLLVFAAAVMTLHNPFVLLWDAGFQLSFAATIGILYVAPLFDRRWELVSSTLSAIVITLPLALYHFGRFSLIAPVTNLLILWTIPILMALGAIAIIASLLFFPFGQLVAWFGWLGLRYVITVVEWTAHLPFASFEVGLPWWGMVIGYIGIFFLYRIVKIKINKNKN